MNRTWVGGGNNEANNPNDWSPTGAPQTGDTLSDPVNGSTINVTGNALRGDAFSIPVLTQGVTFDLTHYGQLNLNSSIGSGTVANVSGVAKIDVTTTFAPVPETLRVNLAGYSLLFGTFDLGTSTYATVVGGEYWDSGTTALKGGNLVLDTSVVGSGTFDLTTGTSRYGPIPSTLEFGGYVSRGQTVNVTGASLPVNRLSSVQIDQPTQFHGTVDLHDFSFAQLDGLAQADSWTYTNDLLSIDNSHGRVIDTLHIVSAASGSPHGLSVSMNSAGDVIVNPGTSFHGTV
jgi:hypothetical protein